MPIPLFPWFLAAAAGLAWASTAGKGASGKGSNGRPAELDPLVPLQPVVPVKPGAGGIPVDQLPTPGAFERLPITSPGQPTGNLTTMPVGGGTPVIVVNAPPPGTVPVAPPALPIVLTPVPTKPPPGPVLSTMPPAARPPKIVPVAPPGTVPIPPPTKVIVVPEVPAGTVPIKPPPNPVVTKKNPREALASETYRMIKESEPSGTVKDPVMLRSFQAQEGLDQSGKYGPGSGKGLIKYGFVPVRPFFWGASVDKNKKDWRSNMLTMARQDPQRRDEWELASQV